MRAPSHRPQLGLVYGAAVRQHGALCERAVNLKMRLSGSVGNTNYCFVVNLFDESGQK
jgi:hypothetical protein